MEQQVCNACPRNCGARREDETSLGVCGMPREFRVSRVALHLWEEPPISGKNGSGTIFFAGCNLRCVFCQNKEISQGGKGKILSADELEAAMLDLRDQGAANINLVTPTHYALSLVPLLKRVKPKLGIPIVYNCGGYEKVETLGALEGLVDIYLPDFKYASGEIAKKYSGAPDYPARAEAALCEMLRQVGRPAFSADGIMQKGVIVRHLVLPGNRKDTAAVLRLLAERFGVKDYLLSLLWQYTPEFALDSPYQELHRRVTTFEYKSTAELAETLGFEGFFQSKSSATAAYTPPFDEE